MVSPVAPAPKRRDIGSNRNRNRSQGCAATSVRHRGDGVARTDVTAAVLDGQTLEALGQEGLSLSQEWLPGLDVAEPSVEV